MKTKSLFITIILGLMVMSFASCSKMDTIPQTGKDDGDGGAPGKPKSFYQMPIDVNISDASGIEALFTPNIGTIMVTINNSLGNTVYRTSIDTSIETRLSINISDMRAGSYAVYFTDADNTIITSNNFIID